MAAPVGDTGVSGNHAILRWLGTTYEHAGDDFRAKKKAQVARDLSAASGVTEQEAADFVKQWAESSNDNDMRSLAIQQDAVKEFGVELSKFTQEKIAKVEADQRSLPDPARVDPARFAPLMESKKQRALLRAMYDRTQAELKTRGITEVKLYRGVILNDTDYKRVESAGFANVLMDTNAVGSWSISLMSAGEFARSRPTGVVFETVVPAGRVLSIPYTGFGCLTEGEVVIIGGVDGDRGDIL